MSVRNIVWIVTFVVVAAAFVVVSPLAARRDTLLRRYGTLLEVDALVRRHHVEPVDPNQLTRGALEGMLSSLDVYSSYLDSNGYAAYKRRLAGEDVGIGVELAREHNLPIVIAPIEGEPAAAAGVKSGDAILAINGKSTEGLSMSAVEGMLSGPPGSRVNLTLRRPATGETSKINLMRSGEVGSFVRGLLTITGETGWFADEADAIGYVRITAFREPTIEQFDAAMHDLKSLGVRAIVLDLRDNPGGLVPAAVAIVDRFIDSGVILRTFNRVGAEDRYIANADGADTQTPLAILVNDSSASAAEIVAGALQDHERATIIGERTFGKGSVQYILELGDGESAIRLTTAYYMLPNGRIIHKADHMIEAGAWGVLPDVQVKSNSHDTDAQLEAAIRVLRSQLDSE